MNFTRLSAALASALLATACSQPVDPVVTDLPPALDPSDPIPVLPIDHPPVGGVGGGSGGAGGGTGGAGGAGGGGAVTAKVTMGTRRLTVAQLTNSFPVALGGSTWQVGAANGFATRKATLGDPDYIAITEENLEPSPLYLKFMADAARDACSRTVTADDALPAAQKVLARFSGPVDTVTSAKANVDANLRYLRLRFHGVKVEASDELPIASYRTAFADAVRAAAGTGTVTAAHVKEGWKVVCIALMTAPEYHFY